MSNTDAPIDINKLRTKLEYYCAYQDRCMSEVKNKMFLLQIPPALHDDIFAALEADNFINEERYALSFARGKHRIKGWGRNRIVNELRAKKIDQSLITKALEQLEEDEYDDTFTAVSETKWKAMEGIDLNKRKQRLMMYLANKGYEMNLIYDKTNELCKKMKQDD